MKKIILSTFVASSFLFAADYTNSIGMVFKEIPAGSFMMGTPTVSTADCPKDNPFTKNNEYEDCTKSIEKDKTPALMVNISSFYMGETEVTQGQWYKVMGNNPAEFQTGNSDMPVEMVTWDDAQKFISSLNQKEGGIKYRLPTDEEWEYAARAGTATKWYCGDSEGCVNSIAVCNTDSPKPVKSKKPNAWGLYDMSGNVWEWTNTWHMWRDNPSEKSGYMVGRGGSWEDRSALTSSANVNGFLPDYRFNYVGFRLLRMK